MNCFVIILLAFCAFHRVSSEISSSSDLNCDFTSTCRWRNSSDVGGHFETTSLLEADAQNRIMAIEENNPKPFAYTAGLMGRMMALLVSEVITCQLGGASIKYWYYKTGLDSQLEVCIRQPPGNRDLSQMRCYDGVSTFGKQWIFRAVELPPIAQPFEIVFKTIYSPPSSVIALDNIVFEATLCESTSGGASEGAGGTFDDPGVPGRTPTQLLDFDGNDVTINQFESVSVPVPTRAVNFGAPTSQKISNPNKDEKRKSNDLGGPRTGPMFASICANVDCTFDENTLCNYLTSSTNVTADDGSSLKKWALSNKSVLNSLTGIPSDISKGGYFLYAGGATATPGDTFILSSNHPITISEPARVDFFVYQAGIRGQFRVCIDDNEDCPVVLEGKDIDSNAQKWKNYYFDINPGQHVLHFVVEGLHNNYVIGVDNIQLLNRFGTSSLAC